MYLESRGSLRSAAPYWLLALTFFGTRARAADMPFDLAGPKLQIHVRRSDVTLPIAEVPNLQPGDRLWMHLALPNGQSVHYLMVVVFLRGITNPPPESWFTLAQTWTAEIRSEGLFVTVPKDAQQALVLLAPEAGGAFSTLRATVRGKPGAFVRAAQDLQQASLDRLRLDTYLDSIRETSSDSQQLRARTALLSRSLNIKLDRECFDKPTAQQVPCLTQNTDGLVLDDQHSQSVVAALTSGVPTDLLSQLSYTPTAKGGYYSPYLGAVLDVLRILSATHTAQYQYIPALALPTRDDLNLRLNNPPSFRNPKSVLVIALPPVHATEPPPLRSIDARHVLCANDPDLVLPVEGAPLAFATKLAHDFVLRVHDEYGSIIDMPAHPDAARGGLVVKTDLLVARQLNPEVRGNLIGSWGFQTFNGPEFILHSAHPSQWNVTSNEASALIVGRQDILHIEAPGACCVKEVIAKTLDGKPVPIEWRPTGAEQLQLKVSLQRATGGSLVLLIQKFSIDRPDELSLHMYAEAARLDSFVIHVGDIEGILRGTRLDEVSKLEVSGVSFLPESLSRADQHDELTLKVQDISALSNLTSATLMTAHIALKDGRNLDLNTSLEAPRPKLTLISKNVEFNNADSLMTVNLGNTNDLPQGGMLQFSLKTQMPVTFPHTELVEVATEDESFHVMLSEKEGDLILEDANTILGILDPMKLLGPSAFGQLKFRPVTAEGVQGTWQLLANLVRIPELKDVRCTFKRPKGRASQGISAEHGSGRSIVSAEKPIAQNVPAGDVTSRGMAYEEDVHSKAIALIDGKGDVGTECILSGKELFLIDAVSTDSSFSNFVEVPDGFGKDTLRIPPVTGKMLYIKLRDDPAIVNRVVLGLVPK